MTLRMNETRSFAGRRYLAGQTYTVTGALAVRLCASGAAVPVVELGAPERRIVAQAEVR